MNRKMLVLPLLLTIMLVAAACGRPRAEAVPAAATAVVETVATEAPAADAAPEEATEEATEEVTEEATEAATEEPVAEAAAESPLTAAADAADSPLAMESPLDAPASPLPTPIPEPPALETETSATAGALTGRIMINNAAGVRPVSNMIVALADVLRGEDGTPLIAGYEAAAARKATTDEMGRFALNNVDEGTYAIILDAVATSVLLADPITGDPILVEISPESVTDLGRIDYETLALPGYTE